jgi:hypothetical protein
MHRSKKVGSGDGSANYSITSSVQASGEGGTERPTLAVLRFDQLDLSELLDPQIGQLLTVENAACR